MLSGFFWRENENIFPYCFNKPVITHSMWKTDQNPYRMGKDCFYTTEEEFFLELILKNNNNK